MADRSLYRVLTALVVGAVSAALVAGCSSNSSAPESRPEVPPSVAANAAKPTEVHIPSLDVNAHIIDLGLTDKGQVEVPPDAKDAGWYIYSPLPGRPGPSVIAAHVNWKGVDGPFAHLDRLKPGDKVTVDAENGASATFEVTHKDRIPKDQFNEKLVYGDPDGPEMGPELRLVTCGGSFDPAAHSYRDNIIVSAKLVA
jgi:sortase (surface protein transpeptidase)